jgi:hypothetical protein
VFGASRKFININLKKCWISSISLLSRSNYKAYLGEPANEKDF